MAGGGGGADDNTAADGHLIAVSALTRSSMNVDDNTAHEDGTDRGTPIVTFGFTESGNSFAGGKERTPSIRVGNGMGTAGAMMQREAAVRRLTPTECERLQGYPDRWTSVSAGKPQADAPRYRQLGNSIAVPVFEWVMGNIVRYETEREARK